MDEESSSDDQIGWYSDTAATFGDRIAGAREGLALSQSDLARKLGIKLKTLRDWENDLSEPRANKLQMMSGVLNVSLVWLLTGEGDGPTDPADDGGSDNPTAEIIGEIGELRREMARLVSRMGDLESRLRHRG